MDRQISLKKIAEYAQVSVNTVSRALNDKDGVNEETRKRIKEIAEAFYYRPNLLARNMVHSQSGFIGIILGDMSNSFFVDILNGFEHEIDQISMSVLVGNSNENLEKERRCLDSFLSYRCRGIAISPVAGDINLIQSLKNENVNFVVIDRPVSNIDCSTVSINNLKGSIEATEYLISCGHSKIAYIGTVSTLTTENDRLAGYKTALINRGIPLNNAYIKLCDGAQDIDLICESLLLLEPRPTAIYISKANLGLITIMNLLKAGIRIPKDISIVLFGDPEWASIISPRITCVQRPIYEIGQISAKLLIDNLYNEKPVIQNILLDTELVIRDSVRNII